MLAIESLGHGKTRTERLEWTEKDSASTILATLDAFEVPGKVYVAGVGQGGRIAVQIALLAPEHIAGIVPISVTINTLESASKERLSMYIDKWSHPYVFRMFEPDAKFVEE